jgi:hypothetical protein
MEDIFRKEEQYESRRRGPLYRFTPAMHFTIVILEFCSYEHVPSSASYGILFTSQFSHI